MTRFDLDAKLSLIDSWILIAKRSKSTIAHGIVAGLLLAYRQDGSLDTETHTRLQSQLKDAVSDAYPKEG